LLKFLPTEPAEEILVLAAGVPYWFMKERNGNCMAAKALKRPCQIRLTTDSTYVMKGITEWMPGWIRKGWRTAGGAPVKNVDLWQALMAAQDDHQVEWQWVKGHAGHPGNERADLLANRGIDELLSGAR
jgi:ribonuclease HI